MSWSKKDLVAAQDDIDITEFGSEEYCNAVDYKEFVQEQLQAQEDYKASE